MASDTFAGRHHGSVQIHEIGSRTHERGGASAHEACRPMGQLHTQHGVDMAAAVEVLGEVGEVFPLIVRVQVDGALHIGILACIGNVPVMGGIVIVSLHSCHPVSQTGSECQFLKE